MKRILLFLLLTSSITSFSQLQVHTVNVTTNDLVYDAVTNRIYASIPSANGSNGNSIGIINPTTYVLENTIFMGSEPTVLAISDNGQYIYAGFSGSSTVRRFNVQTQTADIQFGLGSDTTGPNFAEDIEVMPGNPTTIAVSRKNVGFSPRHEGVAIFDNTIMRPTTTPDHTGSNKIEFTNENTLIGYNNETTEFGIRRLSVNSNGVSNLGVSQNVLSSFGLDFIYHNNYLYATDGKVVDITTAPFLIGRFPNASGPAAFDTFSNKVCYATADNGGNIIFKRFNPTTFLLSDSLPISQSFGTPKSMITCGRGCYAFNSTDNKVVIINDLTLGTNDINNLKLAIYPNPASEYVTINSSSKIENVKLFDLNGRQVLNSNLADGKIFIGKLVSGMYLATIIDENGNTSNEKIIKK